MSAATTVQDNHGNRVPAAIQARAAIVRSHGFDAQILRDTVIAMRGETVLYLIESHDQLEAFIVWAGDNEIEEIEPYGTNQVADWIRFNEKEWTQL